MPIRSLPGFSQQIIAQTLTELAAQKEREEHGTNLYQSDIVNWAQSNYFITGTSKPIKFLPHQIAILRYMMTRREDGHFPAQTMIYSTVKKSGKTAIGSVISRYMAETQTKYGDIYCCGNDMQQSMEREYLDVRRSIELTPGYDNSRETLPGRWRLRAKTMTCLLSGSRIRAVSVDAKGEAGGAPALSVWTELWGFDTLDAERFWDEMTPAPTIADSMRLVETYAGFDDGSSKLLWDLYEMGKQGRQLTAGELAAFGCREDTPKQTYEDLVNGWHEANGDPDYPVPVWHNEQAGIIMYWDSGMDARRMPWQHNYVGDFDDKDSICEMCRESPTMHVSPDWAERYYREVEASEPPATFRRHHLNEWVGAESAFIPIELWDNCGHVHENSGWDPIVPLGINDRRQAVISMDAAVSGDCFGIIAVTRCPYDINSVDIVGYKKWDPADTNGKVDFDEPEQFIRQASAVNNIVQVCYDPYQLEDMAQGLRKDYITWIEPFNQGQDRLKADSQLYDLIVQRRIHHSNQYEIREHIANANAKLQNDEDSKMRIVKKKNGRKIDLAVATSMATSRCLYLFLDN